MRTTVPRHAGTSDAAMLRAALDATGRTQRSFAQDVLGMSLSGLTGWLGGAPCPAAIVRLSWAIRERPALADEIAAAFGE